MAAYALAKWRSPASRFLYVFFIAVLMIPIRLSTLSLVAIPILILYVLLSREFIKGLTAGAVKG